MSTKLDRITELAKEDPKRQFYSIAHMITPEALYAAFRGLRKKASAGVDGVTYEGYPPGDYSYCACSRLYSR
jgi:RNA-directed DNA polymerase